MIIPAITPTISNFTVETAPVKWQTKDKKVTRGNHGLTVAELINKLVLLAANGEIDLNAEVQAFNAEGKVVGVETLQKGLGKVVVLR